MKRTLFYSLAALSLMIMLSCLSKPTKTPPPASTPVITADIAGDTAYGAFNVTITSATVGASIYYTTDGSTPSATNGVLYATPLAIGATITIKAVAIMNGYTASGVDSVTYTVLPGWAALGAGAVSDASAAGLRLTIDKADGSLYAAYVDSNDVMNVKKYAAVTGVWTSLGSPGTVANGYENDFSIKVLNGVPYVMYNDVGNRTDVKKYTGSYWTHVGAAGELGTRGWNLSYCMVTTTTLFAAQIEQYDLTVQRFNGFSWDTLANDTTFNATTVTHVSMDLSSDTLYLCLTDLATAKITLMKYIAGVWTNVSSVTYSGTLIGRPVVRIDDGNGTPYYAYATQSVTDSVFVFMKMTAGGAESISAASLSVPLSHALGGIDYRVVNDVIYLLHQDGTGNVQPTVTKYAGGAWTTVANPKFSISTGVTCVSLERYGSTLYAGYKGGSADLGKAMVMTFIDN